MRWCRILGHDFYWLDIERQCHCRRCGKRNDRYFERQAELRAAFPSLYRSYPERRDDDQPHPDTMIGRR